MMVTLPNSHCFPCPERCQQHGGCSMLQMYFVKLSKVPAAAGAGPVHVYGFMALRDLLEPGRNYIFNRSREDPFTIQDPGPDPSIPLCGPKRGVYFMCSVMIEYDMRIKLAGGADEDDDLPLVDGVLQCNEQRWIRDPTTVRIRGECRGAAVDLSWALVRQAVEATVEVRITELPPAAAEHGLDLSVWGVLPPRTGKFNLFRGLVDRPCALKRFVVAVAVNSALILLFKDHASGCRAGRFDFRATPHGCVSDRRTFGFATIEAKVTWSNLDSEKDT